MADSFNFSDFFFTPVIASGVRESERRSLKADDYDGDHLGQVGGQELEDEGEGGLGVDDVVERHDVRVTQLLQEAGLQTIVINKRSSKKIKTRDARNSFPPLSISFYELPRLASLIAVKGVPSSSCKRISFRATTYQISN